MIAITGLACRFPGAVDTTAFWELIRTGRSGLTRFTPEQLRATGVPTDLLSAPGYVPVGGLIEDQDAFDPDAFGLTDAEAALMDPQQRLFLQTCWQALEQAGHGGGVGAGTVGVYAGASHSAYLESNLRGRWDPTGGGADPVGSLRTAMATHGDYLPLQVAYRLNLTGPAMSITSTCSSSLVAVHVAAQALLAEECDTALAGGVSLIVPQGHGYLHVPDGIYSDDGVVRPYSADGSGIVYTQGVGAVVLRRLEDALADGDPVLAVLHGSAVNNDGALKAGFTAPSPRGQARVITEAQAVAGVEPRRVGYLEGHGTATALGDPIEVAALRSVFGPSERPWCGLGSVKATIGHANTAAGIASLIKTVLARSHGVVPPAPHHEPVNPELGLTGSAFHLSGEARPWPEDAEFAGVSSFGIGGTNCHVVLGPAPELPASTPDDRPQVLVVSGKTDGAARATARALGEHLPAVTDSAALADLAHTLDAGRTHHEHRISVVCSPGDLGSAASALREARPVEAARPRIVFAFPGAGSQYSGMGSVLHRTEPVFAHAVDRCAELLLPLTGHDVRDVVHGRAARVGDAAVGLPALFAVSLGTSELLTSWGVRPDVVLGHSLGEYTAAVVSGGLTLHDAARLVAVRCTEVSRAAGGGAMLSVDLADVSGLLAEHPDVDLAALNGPAGTVLSGTADAIAALEATARAAGLRYRRLRVDAALHSRLVEPAVPAVRAAAARLSPARPEIPVVSTLTGAAVTDELGTADHWARQLRDPVRFSPALREAVGTTPSVLVQVGPGSSLVTLARAHQDLPLADSVTTLDHDHDHAGAEAESVRAAVARLWARGAEVPLDGLRGGRRRRVVAPGYAFQSRRLWIDAPREQREAPRVPALLQLPRWHQLPPLPQALPDGHFLLAADADLPAARALGLPSVLEHDPATPVDGVVVLTRPGQDVESVVLAHADLARGLGGIEVPRLLAVTFGADRVESTDEVCPGAAAARALTRVLAQEHRGIRWRTLDLPASAEPDVVARTVLAELADLLGTPDERGGDIAWRSGTRWRRDIEPWPVTPVTGATTGLTRAIVSGGLGDVGLVVAERLARRGASVVLTSRRALGDVPDAAKTVDALTAEGLDIRTRTLDASDVDGWAALLAECSPDVVVHAAGAAATARAVPLRDVTSDEVTAHLRGKVGGATALREALAVVPESSRPGLVVLMSSAATLVGGIGTGPYAAANAALDAIATGEPRWTSVVWDGWSVGPGGAERDVVLRDALDAATGGRALDLVLDQHFIGVSPSVVAVSRTDLARRRNDAAFTEAAGSSPVGTLADPFEQRVAELWTELFGIAITAPDADFFALGGHSLLATGMLATLGQEYGVRLRLADLLGSPTVAGLAALLRTREVAPPTPVLQAVAAEPDSFPLTRVQHAYWIGRDGGYRWGDVPCHFFLEYDCADLDLARYEDAWNAVIARHPMLRAVVDAQGQAKVLHDLPRFRIRTHDLTALSEEDRERRLATLRERVSRKSGPADRWPLFTVQAALLPGHGVRLFLGVDVLICDAASWWVIDRDLHARYTDPSRELAPVGIHPAACVQALEDRRRGPDGERAASYWRARLPGLPAAPPIPVDETVTAGRFARHRATLDAGRWEQLKRLAAQHRVTPTAVLLTVYADVLADWSGADAFSVVLTLFDRPDIHPDVANVVGDFTSLVLHAVEDASVGTFAERAHRTQQRMFRDLDHREHSALDVLAEKSSAQGGVASVPVVFTSALGLTEVIGADHDPRWIGTKVAALSQTPQTLLDHQVLEEGGELLLQWDVLEPVVPPAQVAAAVADHAARVRRLADDPASWTDGAPPPVDDADVALLLRQGTTPGRTLFLLHPSGGDVLCYTDLSRLIDPGVTVVALTDPGLSGHAAPESVDALAELYLGVLRRHQPHGPYLLGGWSMGGDLAQRVACLLHEAGEHTALLVMLDSNDPTHIVDVPGSPAEADAEVRRRYVASLAGFLGVPLDAGEQPSQDDVDTALRSQGLLRPGSSAAERVAVFARHLRGLAAYEPRRLNDPGTRTLVVKAGRKAPVNSGVGMGVDDVPGDPADLGWTALLARPPRTEPVDAHHYSLLRGDPLAVIAALVNEELTRCERPAP